MKSEKKIEITIKEATGIINQLELFPMKQIKNLVYFFEDKIREVTTVPEPESKKEEKKG
ncbi:hypothetical protein LCGC14_0246500 [marine sediment metagenome]|uniref:Uncharacterized protein n=1 Tax=marine sediment metagenome TaxID=412755 RepID=A0A0F9UAW5_9ZZZZ